MTNVAFFDLVKRQKSKKKGKLIEYTSLRMADYLLPECDINTEEKLRLFSLRTEIIKSQTWATSPNSSKQLKMAPNVSMWLQLASNGSKQLQTAPNGYKWLQMAQTCSKWLQIAPKVSKWLQIAANSFKWLHMAPNIYMLEFLTHCRQFTVKSYKSTDLIYN